MPSKKPILPAADVQLSTLHMWAWILMTGWTVVVVGSWVWDCHRGQYEAQQQARTDAISSLNKDLIYRRWANNHGGVYVPITAQTPPNPYLAHVKERDITTPSGVALTLVNPAYMTRQVHELGKDQYGSIGHLTSLNPLRPENAPDKWEAEALKALEGGSQEAISTALIEGRTHLRVMRPFVTEAPCLKCHAVQGYREGDIRGGISVSVPMEPYLASAQGHLMPITIGHLVLWLLGIVGTGAATRQIGRRMQHQRAMEEVLRDSEMRYRTVVENTDDLITRVDLEGRILFVNSASLKYWGMPPEECVGCSAFDFIHGDDRETTIATFQQWLKSGTRNVVYENRQVHRSGKISDMLWTISVIRDRDGNAVEFNGIAGDITERKRAEEEKAELQEQLYQSRKLEAMGQLAGGVAHDFGNMVSVVLCGANQLKGPLASQPRALATLDLIKEAATCAAQIAQSLLTFTRHIPVEKKTIDLPECVSQSLNLVKHLLPKSVVMTTTLPADGPIEVRADAGQISQVLMNLVINARDAMLQGGRLSISLRRANSDELRATFRNLGRAESYAVIQVADTGCGISQELLTHIFEPFFTTKQRDKGTGLGLSIVQSIVQDHGGRVQVDSQVGLGTTVSVILPCANAASPPAPRGSGRVYMAVSQQQVREMIATCLSSLGYDVASGDGLGDLTEVCRHQEGLPRLLLLEAAAQDTRLIENLCTLRKQGVAIPAIILAGLMPAGFEDSLPENTIVLPKPVEMIQLVELISSVLDRGNPPSVLS